MHLGKEIAPYRTIKSHLAKGVGDPLGPTGQHLDQNSKNTTHDANIVIKGTSREDPTAALRGYRENYAHMTHRASQTRQGTKPTLRLHTREGGDINPFPKIKNAEHKAHRQQNIDKGTPRDPNSRKGGCGWPP
jgi:hypothetical protein